MNTQVGKWGNSLAVRIPGPYAKDLDLKEGMDLEVSLVEGGLLLRPKRTGYNQNLALHRRFSRRRRPRIADSAP